MSRKVLELTMVFLLCAVGPTTIQAQLGKSQGVVDMNTVPEAELASFPGMTPAIA